MISGDRSASGKSRIASYCSPAFLDILEPRLLLSADVQPQMLFMDTARLGEIRADVALAGTSDFEAFASMKSRVDAVIANNYSDLTLYRGGTEPRDYTLSYFSREAAMTYLVTQDSAYADAAYSALYKVYQDPDPSGDSRYPDSGYGLSRAMMSMAFGITYNWGWTGLQQSQRDWLYGKITASLDAWTSFSHSNLGTPYTSNWNAVCRGGELVEMICAGEQVARASRFGTLKSLLNQHMANAYGTEGWNQEGNGYLEYPLEFLIPAVYACQSIGDGGLNAEFAKHDFAGLLMYSGSFTADQMGTSWGVGKPDWHQEGMASLLLNSVTGDDLDYYQFFYDHHMGIDNPAAPGDKYESWRAGTTWSLIYYPEDNTPADPDGHMPKSLEDAPKGAVFFRSAWDDADDILVSLQGDSAYDTQGWDSVEATQLNLVAGNTAFLRGPDKFTGNSANYSTLIVDGQNGVGGGKTGTLELYESTASGGYAIVGGGAKYAGMNLARHVLADFSGNMAEGALSVLDHIQSDLSHVYDWQLCLGQTISGQNVVVTTGTESGRPMFLLRGEGDTYVKGWVMNLPEATINVGVNDVGQYLQVRTQAKSTDIWVTMIVGHGTAPTADIRNSGMDSTLVVGDGGIMYDASLNRIRSLPSSSPPAVTVTAPVAGSKVEAPATIVLRADASDSDGTVSRVDFYADGNYLGSDSEGPYEYTWTGVAAGPHAVLAKSVDNVGWPTLSATVEFGVTENGNVPPTIRLAMPQDAQRYAYPTTVHFSAEASDWDGSVAAVTFYVDGQQVGSPVTTAPYSMDWTPESLGNYNVTAVVQDNAGKSVTSSAAKITVMEELNLAGYATANIGGSSGATVAYDGSEKFTVSAPGTGGLASASDNVQFTYWTLDGDGEISAYVTYGGSPGEAGLMIRDSLDADSQFAAVTAGSQNNTIYSKRRTGAGSTLQSFDTGRDATTNWLKIVRTGNVVSMYRSADGVAWIPFGEDFITMNRQVYVGLATRATGTYTHVSLLRAYSSPQAQPGGVISISFGAEYDKTYPDGGPAGVVPSTYWDNALFGKGQMRLFSTETGGVLSGPVIVWNSFGTVNNADVVGESTAAKMFRTRLHSYGSYAGPSVSVSGMLDAFGGAAYDVYVYIDMADGQNGSSAVQLGPVTYYLNDPTGHTFTGTYELASSTNPSSPQKGNYVRFAGVTGDAFTLTSTGSNRDGINGMQIVRSDTTPIQYPPQAGDDAVSTLLNQPVSINVLANDIDPNPYDTLGISAFTQGLHGTVSRVGSNLVYTPALDWSGVDVFTYTVTDGHDNFDTAGVTVSVNAVVNNPPVAVDDDVQTLIETPITIPVLRNDSDPDAGDTLSLYQVSAPSHGFAQISGTNILYSPAAEYAGQDVFSYTITDGRGGFGTAMVRMQVMSATTARAISVNYEYASSGADDLSVTDVAGAVPSTNWNNVHAASTTNLKDSAGSATTMDIAITGGNLGTYDSVVTPTTPDGKMMDGFYGTYNNSTPITMTLGEIPYAKYDVIVYWGGPPSDRTGTWTPSYSISAAGTATYYLKYSTPNNNVWDGAFSASTATTSSTATYGADYVRWNNLSGAAQTITVRIGGTTRFGISGIQIVEAVDAPKVLAFTRNDGQDVPERLDSVSFRFDQDVSASVNPTDISLFNETTQQDVSIAGATVEYNSVTNTARWDLSELDLPAGLYSVRLRAEGIRNFRDDALDGNGDGVGGDDYVVNHVLIAQRGDASLDGCVDVVDLGILATHYGQPVGAGWTTGDFNGDGAVDVTDLGLLATYYGTGVAMASPASESASDASDASLASEATEFSSSSNDSNALLVAMPLPAGTTTGSAAGETSVAATGETVSLWIEAMPGETGVVVAESSDEVDVLSMTGRAVMPMTEYPVVETPGELIPDVLQIIYSRCQ